MLTDITLLSTILLLYPIFIQSLPQRSHDKRVVCYHRYWAMYRSGRGSFAIENIQPELCTHLIYAFAGLDPATNSIKSLDKWGDLPKNGGKNGYARFVALRDKYPHLKVSISIGGWEEGSANFSALAENSARRKMFAKNAVKFVKRYNFDGLDFYWQFPVRRGGKPVDKKNFGELIKDLREEFKKHKLLLTAALAASDYILDVAYDIGVLGNYLDFMHIMCFDYHGDWDLKTGVNAPLSGDEHDNVEYTVNKLLKLGAPHEKIVLGIPFFGRTFNVLENGSGDAQLGAMSSFGGFQGPYTNEDGLMGFNEICCELKKNKSNWHLYWDDKSSTPYAVSGTKLISYDNVKSLREKVFLAQRYQLAGVLALAMDTDDFHGDCSSTNNTFPLLRAMNQALSEQPPSQSQSNKPSPQYNIYKQFVFIL